MKHESKTTGWSFDCPLNPGGTPPPGGIVLKNVRHDGHNFAKDIRVIALWLEIERRDASGRATTSFKRVRVLDSSNYFTVSTVRTLEPKEIVQQSPASPGGARPTKKVFKYLKEVDSALYYDKYFSDVQRNHIAYGVAATYDAPDLMAKLAVENCDQAGISIEQIFLFSQYSSHPKHEPSGALPAARFHPFVHYKFIGNQAFDPKRAHTRVKSIRFDYRLHLTIDRHHDVAMNAALKPLQNQAGLFADRDSALHAVYKGGIWYKQREGISEGAFEAVEKPLLFEVWAFGLVKGFPRSLYAVPDPDDEPGMDLRCWDNVHWWGARGGELPSAPGAFHAAHIHWRWGSASHLAASGPPFEPDTWPSDLASKKTGGAIFDFSPLVDPSIFSQTIRVAIVVNSPQLDPDLKRPEDLTEDDWKSLFHPARRPRPFPYGEGEDIVLWYSTEVLQQVAGYAVNLDLGPRDVSLASRDVTHLYRADRQGTVFLHGIFFAHDAEPDPSYVTNFSLGSNEKAYWPRSAVEVATSQRWFRPAE
ncbi:MAG: hypothetical protein H0T46_14870 [Deltaproteobacteria bacterium]|nr:hypothetical protein [Deltaproteobacteria bacterium]